MGVGKTQEGEEEAQENEVEHEGEGDERCT